MITVAANEIPELRSPTYRIAEKFIVLLALMFFGNAGVALVLGHFDVRAPFSDPNALKLQLVVYSTAALFMLPWWKHILRAAWQMKLVLMLVALAGVSALWSHAPGVTVRRFAVIAVGTAFGMYFGVRFRRDEQVRLVALAFGIGAAVSLLLVVFGARYGISHGLHQGDWRGIFETKNTLGKMMALECVAALLVASERRLLGSVAVLMAVALVYKSGSRTAMGVCLFLIICYGLSRTMRWRLPNLAPILLFGALVAIVGGAWITHNSGSVFAASGRDATLSGRSALWTFLLMAIHRRPWTGYGFDAFWMDDGGPVMIVIQNVRWNPPHGHNGLLDLAAGLGLIGVIVFLLGFAVVAWKAYINIRYSNSIYDAWPLLFLAFLVVTNVTESSLFVVNSISWVLYASVAASMASAHRALPFALNRAELGKARAWLSEARA